MVSHGSRMLNLLIRKIMLVKTERPLSFDYTKLVYMVAFAHGM